MNEIDEVQQYHLTCITELEDRVQELLEELQSTNSVIVNLKRVNKEWEQLWKPIDDLVRSITPLGCDVSKEVLSIVEEYFR